MKRRISLTLCTIDCSAYSGHRMIQFLINESGILPRIEPPLKHVAMADSVELKRKSGVLPLCATHVWDSLPSQEIFECLSYVLEFYNCSGSWVSFMSRCVILLFFSCDEPVWLIVPAMHD